MKKLAICLALACLLGFGAQAGALIGTIDDVPAATLLLPYFEVSLDPSGQGQNTLFSINNASASAALTHVTVWSDQSVPVLDFDVYLTGFDVQTISMRDILVNGVLPRTADLVRDPVDAISPQGPISDDITYPNCAGFLPPPVISATFKAHLQAWLCGKQSPATGNCAGANITDRSVGDCDLMRGYVTIDVVNQCSLLFPSQAGYFVAGGLGVAANDNVIWGDYFYVHPGDNFAQGETLVHIEACPSGESTVPCFVPGDHTFYGRYVAATAVDGREPLPTTWGSRYLNGGGFTGGTDFLVWREANQLAAGYTCANPGPAWYPLQANQIVIFDEEEQPVQADQCPSGDPTCEQEIQIPNEAQRTDVAIDLLSPFEFGWVYLNLQHPGIIAAYGDDNAQSWVTAVMDAEGRFSVGLDGVHLDPSANEANEIILPVGGGGAQ